MSRYLAVDGGGTKTEICIADEQGIPLFSVFSGSASFKSVGREKAMENILRGLEEIRNRGIALADIRQGVWGMSGCDTDEDHREYEDMLAEAGLPLQRHKVVNDAVPAYYSAASGPGAVVIGGTGAIAVGVDRCGNTVRCGGWHYAFSDLGSGCWMGTRLLQEAALWLDGCREEDPVFPVLCGRLGAQGEQALHAMAALQDADRFAAFARLVLETDSPVCRQIREEAADWLCRYGTAVLNRLQIMGEKNCTLVLAGGLFRNDGFFHLTAEHFPGIPVVRAEGSLVSGGIKMALYNEKGSIQEPRRD